jgi:DNA-binding transcriptional ArsR family regulator
MARLATTADAFNAVAEPQRRQILALLSRGEHSVNEVAGRLRLRQPQVSKHLAVLKKVGLVSNREVGKQHLYQANPEGLRPIFEWVMTFDRFWRESFDRMDEYLKELQQKENANDSNPA